MPLELLKNDTSFFENSYVIKMMKREKGKEIFFVCFKKEYTLLNSIILLHFHYITKQNAFFYKT